MASRNPSCPIDIIMKHLISKFIVIIFITMGFISCRHITPTAYNKDHTFSSYADEEIYEVYSEANPPPEKHRYIYCTPEDKKRGKKAIFGDINAPCGLSKIQPMQNRTLEIKRIVSGVEKLTGGGDILLGHHLLLLKSGSKVLQEIKVETEDDPFWYEVVFVKIRKNVYWHDLNNDGYPEFAILPRDTGNALYRTVNIYTLKDDSFHFYGQGKYLWEAGEHVLLNCPKCWKFDLDECKKCT